MTNPLAPDPLKTHFRLVDIISDIAPAPRPWLELRRRWEAFTELGTPCRDQLVTAVIDGGGDMPTLSALATAEGFELGQRASVVNAVRKAVLARLTEIYAKAAAANYGKVAKEFDAVAGNFADVATLVDPELDAASMVDQSDQSRQAWINAAIFAGKLDRLVPVLSRRRNCAPCQLSQTFLRCRLAGSAHRGKRIPSRPPPARPTVSGNPSRTAMGSKCAPAQNPPTVTTRNYVREGRC